MPGLVLALWIGLLVAAAVYADGWPTDNRIERWGAQLESDPGWDLLRERFGGDEAVLVRLDGLDPASESVRGLAEQIERDLAAEASVAERVSALTMLPAWPWGQDGSLAPSSQEGTAGAIAAGLDLWSADPARLDYVLRIDTSATPATRAALSQTLEGLQVEAQALGATLRFAGHPLVSAALDKEARRVERTFVPLLVLLAALGAVAFLRSPVLAGLALLPAASASVGARAAARAWIGPSDLILVAAGPIAFVLGLAATLHLVLRFQYHLRDQADCAAAARRALRDKLPASTLAAVTTAVGFGVFRGSALASVASLGTLIAATVLVSTPIALFGTAYLLGSLRTAPACPSSSPRPWRRLAAAAMRRRPILVPLALALFAGAGFAATHLGSATNGVAYFPAGHPVRQQFESLEAEGASLSSAEVMVESPSGQAWTPAQLREVGLAAKLAEAPGAEGVIGPELILDAAGGGLAADLLAQPVLKRAGRLDSDGTFARWTVRFGTGESDATGALLEQLRAAAAQAAPGQRAFVSGSVPRLHAMQDTLVGTLARSLTMTLIVTTLLFLLVVRSPRELLAAVCVNLFPVAMILLLAACTGLPLDGATTMVGAVVLGLAVDNTFHLLHAQGPAPRSLRSRLSAFGAVGGAASVGSISLALGFGTLILSGFAPTARFGGLCAAGALAAWAADLVLLPALLPGRSGARKH